MRTTTRRRADTRAERAERRAAIIDPGPVMEAAAAFLAVRPRSVTETSRRLRHLGYPEPLVEQVIGQLIELGYLDDVAFARAWVESRDRARPRGAAALRRELAIKGISREVIGEVLAARSDSASEGEAVDLAAARRLLERRRSALEREADPLKRRQKAYALLARNGFDPDVCREAASWLTPRD